MLDVRRHGTPIAAFGTRHSVQTGISMGVQIPGMVPLFEELDAQAARGLTSAQWQALSWRERALIIAHARAKRDIALHQSDAVSESLEKSQGKSRARRKVRETR